MAQRILVLDDEENYVEMLKALLEQHYFLVDSETNPEKALKSLEEVGYDLIISDYKMPVMDGADFLRKAREIGPDLPFIIISGLMNTPELVKVANIGVTLVLEKPIDIENFLEHVRRFVKPLDKEEFEKISQKGGTGQGHSVSSAGRLFVKAYPDALEHLCDHSPSQQFFLQDVWDSLKEQDHVFIKTPPGGEVELMLREFARWTTGENDRNALVDVGCFGGDYADLLTKLASASGDNKHLVGFANFAGSTMESQEGLVAALRESPENLSYVYFIDGELLDADNPLIHAELLDLINISLCNMPPLGERLADMAAYTMRYLPRMAQAERRTGKGVLDPRAGHVLLAYGWPGNFAELLRVLRTAVILGDSGPLNIDDLNAAFNRLGVRLPQAADPPTLENALMRRQHTLLEQTIQETQTELVDLWPALLSSIDSDYASKPLAEIPLLYPELLDEA